MDVQAAALRGVDSRDPVALREMHALGLVTGRPAVNDEFDAACAVNGDVIEILIEPVQALIEPPGSAGRPDPDHDSICPVLAFTAQLPNPRGQFV